MSLKFIQYTNKLVIDYLSKKDDSLVNCLYSGSFIIINDLHKPKKFYNCTQKVPSS